jgi:hypothetical protein
MFTLQNQHWKKNACRKHVYGKFNLQIDLLRFWILLRIFRSCYCCLTPTVLGFMPIPKSFYLFSIFKSSHFYCWFVVSTFTNEFTRSLFLLFGKSFLHLWTRYLWRLAYLLNIFSCWHMNEYPLKTALKFKTCSRTIFTNLWFLERGSEQTER